MRRGGRAAVTAWALAVSITQVVTGAVAHAAPASVVDMPRHGDIEHGPWTLGYRSYGSDGLRVFRIDYREQRMASSVSLPQIRVDYPDGKQFDDQLGLGDLPARWVHMRSHGAGFDLRALYLDDEWPQECSYRYVMTYRFTAGGEIDPRVWISGPGCGPAAHYHLSWRVDLDVYGSEADAFRYYRSRWRLPPSEGLFPERERGTHGRAQWKVVDLESGTRAVRVVPTFPGRGFVTAVHYVEGQGDRDLHAVTFPARFVDGEGVQQTDVVAWYRLEVTLRRADGCPTRCPDPTRVGFRLVSSGFVS